jgi:hypothetical protein
MSKIWFVILAVILAVVFVIVFATIAILTRTGRKDFVLKIPVDPELVNNGSFEKGDFNNDPNHGEPEFGPVNFGSIPLARAVKLLRSDSSALQDWKVLGGSGKTLPPSCQPTTTDTNLDAIAWLDSDGCNQCNLLPADGKRFIDLTGYCLRESKAFGGVESKAAITLQPFQEYELAFSIGVSSVFNNPKTVTVRLEIPERQFSEPFYVQVPESGVTWKQFNIRFYGGLKTLGSDGSSVTLRFTAVDGGEYVALDNVSLKRVCFIVNAILFGANCSG